MEDNIKSYILKLDISFFVIIFVLGTEDVSLRANGTKEAMDVESQLKARRGRWLDTCLVLSVLVLFAALAALAAAGVLVVRNLQSRLPHAHPEFEMSKVTGNAPDNKFKMENYAYLETNSSELSDRNMLWDAVSFLDGQSVGSFYKFDSRQQSLQVKQAGTYFMYLELNVTCTYRCDPGRFSVQVLDKLNCEVDLPMHNSSEPFTKQCWTVSMLPADTYLLPQMTVSNGRMPSWKLHSKGTGFGIFLVN